MYNIIDLFCGSGGLSYGFNLAGYRTLLGIDNDKAAIKTFEENHKESKGICGDITQITTDEILEAVDGQDIDVIVGGPPCQGMSLAGPRISCYWNNIRVGFGDFRSKADPYGYSYIDSKEPLR